MALASNQFRGVVVSGLLTLIGFIMFCVSVGTTEYYHTSTSYQRPIYSTTNSGSVITGYINSTGRIGYGLFRKCFKLGYDVDDYCQYIDNDCYPGLLPLNDSPLSLCARWNVTRAFAIIALFLSGVGGLLTLLSAYTNQFPWGIIALGSISTITGVISTIEGAYVAVAPFYGFIWGYSFLLGAFAWALVGTATGLFVASKWDEKHVA